MLAKSYSYDNIVLPVKRNSTLIKPLERKWLVKTFGVVRGTCLGGCSENCRVVPYSL